MLRAASLRPLRRPTASGGARSSWSDLRLGSLQRVATDVAFAKRAVRQLTIVTPAFAKDGRRDEGASRLHVRLSMENAMSCGTPRSPRWTLSSALISVLAVACSSSSPPSAQSSPPPNVGFRPAVDGFAFPNYGPGTENLTVDEVRRMFGDKVCATKGAGFVLAVDDIRLDKSQHDTLLFSADNTSIAYKTVASETPRIVLGVQLEGADYRFALLVHGGTSGIDVHVDMDLKGGKLRVRIAGGTYDIEVQRISDQDVAVFTHRATSSEDGDVLYFDYGTWQGDGTPMQVGIDRGGDGSVDGTESLSDEG